MRKASVITADIVNSTKLSKVDLKKLMNVLVMIFQKHQYEFFRGDSFQVLVRNPTEALQVLLAARLAAMKLLPAHAMPVTDVRTSIGIGNVKLPVRVLQTATGEAFVLSGRNFDKMGKDERTIINCSESNEIAAVGLNIIARFIDYLFQRLTVKQAAVVFELLMSRTQTETARRLKKSQATINKHVQSAGWVQIEMLLKNYELLVNSIQR